MSLTPGTHVGPYEVIGALGAGGMGEVYRARDTRLDRNVALKILPESFAADPDRLMRFEREAERQYKFGPNLSIPHYGLSRDGRGFLMVKEEPGGRSLNLLTNWLPRSGAPRPDR